MKNSRVMIFDFFHGSTRFMNIFGLALVLVLSILVISGCWCPFESRSKPWSNPWENRCKLTLRALGSTQLAFADMNSGEFGTWDDLMKQEYIQKGYDQSTIIDNYKIVVFNVQKSVKDEDGKIISPADFLIVAVPDDIKYELRTFAIGTDQTPRVWIGDSADFDIAKIDMTNPNQWEPATSDKVRKRNWSPF